MLVPLTEVEDVLVVIVPVPVIKVSASTIVLLINIFRLSTPETFKLVPVLLSTEFEIAKIDVFCKSITGDKLAFVELNRARIFKLGLFNKGEVESKV